MSMSNSPGDWLSRLLALITVTGRLEIRCSYGPPWQVAATESEPGQMPFHIILQGSAVLETPGLGAPELLQTGDIVILLHGSQHLLHDGSGLKPLKLSQKIGLNLIVSENSGVGDHLEMLCGRISVSSPHDRFIREYLPGRLIVRTANTKLASEKGAAVQLSNIVALMRSESMMPSLGGGAMLNALSTALFTMALRLASESEKTAVGLLAMVSQPRLAPALTAIFENPAHNWSLSELANRCNMSRATLIRHFQDKIGKSASAILTDVRMARAAQELISTSLSTEIVAEKVGYQSVAAFRRAFIQHMGMTPGNLRRSSGKKEVLPTHA